MPSAVSPNPRAGSGQPDELDRLLEDDNAVEDFFRDLPGEVQNNSTAQNEPARDEDQEVLVKKKRVPIPKLDENRCVETAAHFTDGSLIRSQIDCYLRLAYQSYARSRSRDSSSAGRVTSTQISPVY